PQQLLTLSAMALAVPAHDPQVSVAAMLGGAALGTAVGVGWASSDPDPVRALGLHSGAYWGFGLTSLTMAYTYAFGTLDDDRIPQVMLAGADLGAAIGYGLPALLPVSQDQISMANAGGFVGAGAAFGFVALTSRIIWYPPHAVAAVVGGAGIVGGTLGVVLANRFEQVPEVPVAASLIHTRRVRGAPGRPRVQLAVPVPRVFVLPDASDRVAVGIDLVNQAF
ncbi:MAG: hypothetical protein GXP62_08575, partial [Oligoflexia bacterium]|nr:hypothetical protein [Oligoflexia bacterium]